MSKTKAGPISADRLKSFIERIERLEEERKNIASDIRDIYSEAKGVGYDVKTMRRIVQLRKKDVAERDEEEQLLDLYCHALGMVAGVDTSGIGHNLPREPTEDELMDKAAKIVREVDLCVTHLVAIDGTPPKIEAIKSLIGCSTGKAHKLRAMVIERLAVFSRSNAESVKTENENAETAVQDTPPDRSGGTNPAEGHSAAPVDPVQEVETVLIAGLGVSGKWRESVASSDPVGSNFDPYRDMPAFLRREKVRA